MGRLKEAKEQLLEVQTKLQLDMSNLTLQRQERERCKAYMELAAAELSLYRQKVKEVWAREMDHNNGFFHARIYERQARARIVSLVDEEGQRIDQEERIADLFIQYYENLLGKSAENFEQMCQY